MDWYDCITDSSDEDTGMWIVKPVPDNSTIIHLNSILRCAHLIPVFGQNFIDCSLRLTFIDSLDVFLFYKYAGHHMHEIVF